MKCTVVENYILKITEPWDRQTEGQTDCSIAICLIPPPFYSGQAT